MKQMKISALKWTFIGFLITGVILGIVSLCIYGFNFGKLYDDFSQARYYTEETQSFDETYSKFTINTSNCDVSLKSSNDDKFHLTYWKHSEYSIITLETEGSEFLFKEREKFSFRASNFKVGKYLKIVLEVPTGFVGEMSLIEYNGDVEVNNVALEKLSIENYNGNVKVRAVTVAELTHIKSHNGEIALTETSGERVSVETFNGDVKILNGSYNHVIIVNYNGDNSVTQNGVAMDYRLEFVNHNGRSYLHDGTEYVRASGVHNSAVVARTVYLKTYNGNNRLKFVV